MGYLRQRKQEERIDITLKSFLLIIFFMLIAGFYSDTGGFTYYLNAYRFQYYAISFILFLFCLYKKFFFYAFLYMLIIVFSFVSISFSAPVIFNDSKEEGVESTFYYINSATEKAYDNILSEAKKLNSDYVAINNKDHITSIILNETYENPREGIIRLSNNYSAYFISSIIDDSEVVALSVDFEGISLKEAKVVYRNLVEFIELQENPVFIIGDFGIPAWNSIFVNFVETTGLEVKNRVILTDGVFRFNPFSIPTIYVLGYKNMGLQSIKFLPKNNVTKHPILFKIRF